MNTFHIMKFILDFNGTVRGEGGEREILPHGGSRASPGGTDNERIKTGRFADARH